MVDEAYLRSVAAATDDLIDAADVELLRAAHEALAVEDGKVPSPEQVATAARAEGPLQSFVEAMADMVEDLRRGAAAFASRPGEEALAVALLNKAASVEEVRAGAAATVDAARRMQEDDLRRIAATEEDLIDPEEVRAIRESSLVLAQGLVMGYGAAPSPEQVAEAAAAAEIGEAAAELTVEDMAHLAARLRKGAASFASRPGQEAIAVALLNKATSAEKHGAEARAMAAICRRYRSSLPLQLC